MWWGVGRRWCLLGGREMGLESEILQLELLFSC